MVGRTLPTPTILYTTFYERAMLRAMLHTAVLFFSSDDNSTHLLLHYVIFWKKKIDIYKFVLS